MKISNIQIQPLYLKFKEPYHWAGRVDEGAAVLLIEIQSENGLCGFGESTAPLPADGALAIIKGLIPRLVGKSIFDVERLIRDERFLGGFNDLSRFSNLLLAGVDMALWDLMGRTVGWPVHRFWGGLAREKAAYFGFVQGDTPEELARSPARLGAENHCVIDLEVGR
ncbi:MAG: mandelate racemase/muconate lactonizing enzyme family protein, partial [Deltaproteobacteria bacterium]|nr:mandelate racemase/muconate lactonizing enzyme family protein [Deltaproteobacteria bacterium]